MLIQYDCHGPCSPHALCLDCGRLTCMHTLEFNYARGLVASLPTPEQAITTILGACA